MFELILSTESKVISTNIQTFEEQANNYLATLTSTFETDDDFAKAKDEVKELKEIEAKIRTTIDEVAKGNVDIAQLLETAENIAERFRQERLTREKLVKEKEAEIKKNIIDQAFNSIMEIRYTLESDISLALEKTLSKETIKKRLEEASKRRSTFATLTKSVNAMTTAIQAEIATESARLVNRRKMIPISHDHLFKDAVTLIASDEDLKPLIEQRIEEEKQRLAEQAQRDEEKKVEHKVNSKAEPETKTLSDKGDQQQAVTAEQHFAERVLV